MKLYGLSGRKRSGKDTVASILADADPENVYLLGFADDLKAQCSMIFGIPLPHFYDDNKKDAKTEKYPDRSPRDLAKWLGAVMRQFSDSFWLDRVSDKIAKIRERNENAIVVITDVRYLNEAIWVNKMDGELVYINAEERLGPNQDTDASETSFAGIIQHYKDNDWKYNTVHNNKTLDYLRVHTLWTLKYFGRHCAQ